MYIYYNIITDKYFFILIVTIVTCYYCYYCYI